MLPSAGRTVTRLQISSAMPRQSNPEPKFEVVAGTRVVTASIEPPIHLRRGARGQMRTSASMAFIARPLQPVPFE